MATIPVIDDERMLCDLFQEVLRRHGHEVFTAYSGREGIESHSEQSPTRRSPPDSIYTPIDQTSDYPVYGDDAMAKVPGQRFQGRPCHHEWRRANGWLPEAKEHEE